eukprot:758634-Hanusia_phi.AAC.2
MDTPPQHLLTFLSLQRNQSSRRSCADECRYKPEGSSAERDTFIACLLLPSSTCCHNGTTISLRRTVAQIPR